jgi:transposase
MPIHSLKDYRRFATRFDKLATTFEATVALIATRIWFLV